MLRTFNVERYDIGALHHASERMSLREDWSRSQVWKALDWIAARNTTGSSIYVRPARTLAAHPWIFVDDLNTETLARLEEEHRAGIVVETSPSLFHAWLRIQEPVTAPIRTAIARELAKRFGGDPGSIGGHQFGRLPGTTNRKPNRGLADGRAPFARLRAARNAGTALAHVTIPSEQEAATAATATRTDPDRSPQRRGDQSRRDFAIACRLVEAGRGDGETAAAIQAARLDKKAQRIDYLERTVRAAREHIERRST